MARAVLEVDLDAIAANWRALDAMSGPGVETAAVVKANAYGCGAERVGPALAAAGVRTFFVAHLEEGMTLRGAVGSEPVIHVLNGFGEGEGGAFLAHALRPVLNAPGQVAAAGASGLALDAALQIDSGMNRLGLERDEIGPALDTLGKVRISLVMSHLHSSDVEGTGANIAQRAAFLAAMPRIDGAQTSLAATGGILLGPDYHFEMTRPGVGLFGGMPFADARPVIGLRAPVIQLRDVTPGEAVGYGASFVAKRGSRIATIPVGYADGLPRAASNRGTAFFEGRPLPFAGRVSMDLITLDATDCSDIREGSEVELLGPHQSVDRLAEAAGTIGYEILTSLGARYDLRYKGLASD